MRSPLWGFVVAAALWGGAVFTDPSVRTARADREELFYYPNGQFLKEAVLGYDQAAAALNWVRTVQYYGEHARGDQTYDRLYHMCDVVTDLDPRFEAPYVFGSFVLLTDGHRPNEGLTLLRKGRENNPQSWRVWFESGFVYYICLEDYVTAGDYLQAAAGCPGAPDYATRFAAYVNEKAGSLEAAILLWTQAAQSTSNPELRAKAEKKVEELREAMAKQGQS